MIISLEKKGDLASEEANSLPPPKELPRTGPLGYDRFLELFHDCARASLDKPGSRRGEEFIVKMPSQEIAEYRRSKTWQSAFQQAAAQLNEANRRFSDEILAFPLMRIASREDLKPEEVRVLAYLLKEDVGVFEGKGQSVGQTLLQVACGDSGDFMPLRRLLAPDGKLRRLGFIERVSNSGGFSILSRSSSPSVVEGTYSLTDMGRKVLLGPLLERDVSENKDDGLSRHFKPRFGLGAVALLPAHRQRIEALRAELKHRKLLYETWGLGNSIHYGRGIVLLLEGAPGTGKTMLAEAFAGEEGLQFMVANLAQLESMWLGESEKHYEKLFREARAAGALLFIDEADGLFASRDLAWHSWEIRQVNVLLKEIEEFDGLCVLATNNVPVLDRAIESRISLRLQFKLPDTVLRHQIWKKHLPASLPLAADVDLLCLARRYEISGRDIKQAVLAAARAALARGGPEGVVSMADLDQAASERFMSKCSIGFSQTLFEKGSN